LPVRHLGEIDANFTLGVRPSTSGFTQKQYKKLLGSRARLLDGNLAQAQLVNDIDDFARVRCDEDDIVAGHDIPVLADIGNLTEDILRNWQERDVCG
jgi:hypothetical protein